MQCNKCFELDFGSSIGKFDPFDHGSRQLAAAGKRMIVMGVHGNDGEVRPAQIDLMIPGGGVGYYTEGCSAQLPNVDMGLQYGGILSRCQGCPGPGRCVPERRKSYDELSACVKSTCNASFGSPLLPHLHELKQGCDWFVDWFMLADTPRLRSREIECPQEILSHAVPL